MDSRRNASAEAKVERGPSEATTGSVGPHLARSAPNVHEDRASRAWHRRALASLGALAVASAVQLAAAQPQPGPAKPAGKPAAQPDVTPAAPADVEPLGPDPVAAELAPKPSGLTPAAVGAAAARTSATIRQKRAELRAAAARVDQALVAYFPKLTLTATYTRLSPFENTYQVPDPATGDLTTVTTSYPENTFSAVASLAVPISDYLLRLSQSYASAEHNEKASRLQVEAEVLAKSADAKVTFFNWARARGQVVVAREAVLQARAHVVDAQRLGEVGVGSRADVLRFEAQVASAEQLEIEAQAMADVAEEQLRIATGTPAGSRLEIGIDVMSGSPTGAPPGLATLQEQALARRLEVRALDETRWSLQESESVAKAGRYPRLDGFADASLANPNQRAFPQVEGWDSSWQAGVRLTWVVNDTFTAGGAADEARARTEAVVEQKAALRETLRAEVAAAWADARKAASVIAAADRGLVAAVEAHRVKSELFRNGRGSSVDLVDAQTEVTRAQLKRLDAHVGAHLAKTRLDHATGADVPGRRADGAAPSGALRPLIGRVRGR
jgi:outer membrane protein